MKENLKETSREKADRLNVPIIPLSKRHISEEEHKSIEKKWNAPVVAICECGKEVKLGDRKDPCGKTVCPFGILII